MKTNYKFQPKNNKEADVWINGKYRGLVNIDKICNYIIYYKGLSAGLADCVALQRGHKVYFTNNVNNVL